MINTISEEFLLPLGDLLTGQSVHQHLNFLFKSQYWSREQIYSWQNERLRLLIHHAYSNVPFYTELFRDLNLKPDDIQTRNDLKKLPIITKEDLKRNKQKHLAKNLNKEKIIFSSSSGSTGEPFQFYTTRRAESMNKATAIRAWYWMGYRLGDKYAKVSMNPRNSFIKKVQDCVNNSLYLSSQQLIDSEFTKLANQISNYDPKFIRCYPVPLLFLSRQIAKEKGHYPGTSLIAINTTGSTLHPDDRKEIEEVFGVKIFDAYSCEGGPVFAQCPAHSNYHPAEEYAISEFIEDSVTRSDPQKPMRHITTDLYNYASPFIRYDTQDYVVLGEQTPCPCGMHYINIAGIRGRDSDILITPSGKLLIVENFVAYFEWIPEVEQIQVVQDKLDEILIRIVVNKSYNDSIEKKITDYWKEYIGDDVHLIVKVVEEIKLTPTGKLRTVVRNPSIRLNA